MTDDTSAQAARIRAAFLAGYGAAARAIASNAGFSEPLLGSYQQQVECIEQKVRGCQEALAESASMSDEERRQVQMQLRQVLNHLGEACDLLQGKLKALPLERPATHAST